MLSKNNVKDRLTFARDHLEKDQDFWINMFGKMNLKFVYLNTVKDNMFGQRLLMSKKKIKY